MYIFVYVYLYTCIDRDPYTNMYKLTRRDLCPTSSVLFTTLNIHVCICICVSIHVLTKIHLHIYRRHIYINILFPYRQGSESHLSCFV
jgi:hypothetical protein